MKQFLTVIGVIFVLLIITLLAVPTIFKDDIIAMVKQEANNAVHADIDFEDVDISIFSNFPDFALDLHGLTVTGVDSFAGMDLANIEKLSLVVDLKSVISGDEMIIKHFGLYNADVNMKILADGSGNYDIAIESDETTDEPILDTVPAEPLVIGLESYEIVDLNFVYDDMQADIKTIIKGLDLSGSGTTDLDNYQFKVTSEIAAFTFQMEGIDYIHEAHITYVADIIADLINWKFTLGQNEFAINGIHTGIDGWVAMPTSDIDMDLKFHAHETDFKSLLSMVPAIYATDFEDITTAGSFAFSGFAKGKMTETLLPAFDVNLTVGDGTFQYPDLPASVQDIQVDVDISNPGGSEDATVIDVKKIHMDMAGNPVDVSLLVRTPVSDPYVKTRVVTNLNLASLDQVMPMEEGEHYEGMITSNLLLEGKVSALENEQYDQFYASGTLALLDLVYRTGDLPYDITVNNVQSTFHPENVTVENCELTLGKSDVRLIGKLDNVLSYYFGRQPLRGKFDMSSRFMDLNELMDYPEDSLDVATNANELDQEPDTLLAESAAIPGDIDFVLASKIDQLLYEDLVLLDVHGIIVVRESRATLQNVQVKTLGGAMTMDGYFDTKNAKVPVMDFDLDMRNIQIPQAYKAFNTVQKLAPIAETAQGGISTKLHLNTQLDGALEPIYTSLTGGGALVTHEVIMQNAEGLRKLAETMNMKQFSQIELNDVNISYRFEGGRIKVDPFDLKLGNSKATVAGSNGFDQTMDYNIAMEIPSSEMSGLGGMASSFMSQLGGGSADIINVDVGVLGTVLDPKFKPRFGGSSAGASLKDQASYQLQEQVDEVKLKAQAEVDKAKKAAEQKLNAEKERLIKEAEEKKKAAEAKAKAEADRLKAEAEAKAKAEADKVKEQAKDKVKGLFK